MASVGGLCNYHYYGWFDKDYLEYHKQRRQRWVDALKAGNNPFTPEELEPLRQTEG